MCAWKSLIYLSIYSFPVFYLMAIDQRYVSKFITIWLNQSDRSVYNAGLLCNINHIYLYIRYRSSLLYYTKKPPVTGQLFWYRKGLYLGYHLSKAKLIPTYYRYDRSMVYCASPLAPIKTTRMLSAWNDTSEKPGVELLKSDNSFMLLGRGSPPVPVTT